MKKINYLILLLLIVNLGTAGAVNSELLINTLEEFPGSFTDSSGRLTGISVDVVREIQRRIGNTDPIRKYPWARTYRNALKQPNVVAFTATRTKERENKFHWITRITRIRYSFFIRKGASISITTLDDAKSLKSIGVMRSSVWEQLLESKGFANLDPVSTHELNVKKLIGNRVSAMYFASAGLLNVCRKPEMDCNDIYPIFTTNTVESYIIISKNGTPMTMVNQWKKAAEEIKNDGTFEAIALKWVRYMELNGFGSHYSDGAFNLWRKK
ncbi:MAG: transporter substrate-binding domain-containing protein [Desulfobacter sp.]|nr:MAG: transporter substrate-binding domain-containing protein [Desulfobacter sp.]